MKILNIYFSATGNTAKIAQTIESEATKQGHAIDTIAVKNKIEVNFLDYDFIFMGSGVYHWLPGKSLMDLVGKSCTAYRASGELPRNAPRRSDIKAVTYCTYGGTHTGINEAYPTTQWMGQFFDHLGIEVMNSWHIIGEFHGNLKELSVGGRLGDIRSRPNAADLQEVAQMTGAILKGFVCDSKDKDKQHQQAINNSTSDYC